ncbi:MAG TPA: hypothetical protein VNK50_06180 [Calidithermus sp.]|nr:hypothetical protein [Calidithermus sp.]
MAFTVRDFQDLVRALERRAEWRAELRRLLLTDEVLALPEVVRGLTDQIAGLAAEVRELAQQVRALAADHAGLVVQVRELTASHASLAAEVRELAQQVRELTEQVRGLVVAQRRTDDRLGRLEGRDLERWYRERASSVFHRILARARLVDHHELALLLDAAVEAGTITEEELAEILLADVVVRGRREQREAYAVAEVSVVVDAEDLRRALARARLLERATGRPVVPVVAGERVAAGVAEEARAAGVWRLLDGRAEVEPSPTA